MIAKEAMQLDIRHFYLEKGRGTPLILLHGNGESSDYFRGQIDVFAERYHVYAPDTRGHGRTPRGASPFTIRQFAEDLLGCMDAHGMEKAHLLVSPGSAFGEAGRGHFRIAATVPMDRLREAMDRLEKLHICVHDA